MLAGCAETLFIDPQMSKKRKIPPPCKTLGRIWKALEVGKRPDVFGWLNSEKIRINPEYDALIRKVGLDTMAGVFATDLGVVISHEKRSDVLRLEIDHEGVKRVFFLKRLWSREVRRICKRAGRGDLLGPSSVRSEYEKIEKLGEFGLRAPKLVAHGTQRFCCGVVNSFIMTEGIPNAMGVDFLVGTWMEQQPEAQRAKLKTELYEEVARCLKIMHANGFEHHDLFLRNMMVSGQDMSALYILDCPCAFIWPSWIMRMRRVHDLATLDAASTVILSPQQRLRFMYIYLGRNRLKKQDKALIRKVVKRADPMRPKQVARLGRSIAVDNKGDLLKPSVKSS